MKHIRFLSLACILVSPQLLVAAEPGEHRYTSKDQINFAAATLAAFDHSGKQVSRSVSADGTITADHNGSMGSVTVARLEANGTVATLCTTDIAAAKSWMAGEGGNKPVISLNVPAMEK